MLTPADVLVASFNHWLDDVAGGGPWGPLHRLPPGAYPPLLADRSAALDRLHSHTVRCPSCRAFVFVDYV